MFVNATRQSMATVQKPPIPESAWIPPMRRDWSAFSRSVLALAVMLVALSTLCGAAEVDYPKSPVPTREEFEAIAQKANAGDAESQRYLGIFYANGDIVAQDYAKAAG